MTVTRILDDLARIVESSAGYRLARARENIGHGIDLALSRLASIPGETSWTASRLLGAVQAHLDAEADDEARDDDGNDGE